ncbi:hypothetical protein SAMN06297422_101152 [Lachnospiraceae bacterium]|nr:hypothetical protein SAMN06297422_101152 [Lachnospiraceae bacterium]
MLIKDMFLKDIDRDINGVIKVGQKDRENVFQELDEYVVTEELEKYMNRLFDAYIKGLEGRTDKMGIWISGFFGSGKSHFLKIMSYILSDKVVEDESGKSYKASEFFLDGIKIPDVGLQEKLKKVVSYSEDTDVILFNIDSKSAANSRSDKEAIKDVFMKVFNDYLGYCGALPFLADFERKLDLDGNYDDFKEKFEEINGASWIDSREDFYFIQDELVETISSLGIMSEEAAKNWAENAQNSYNLSIDQFADHVKKYCMRKGPNHHIVFLVDEIGQYIADDSKLMVNLQTVTEELGIACQGKAWVAVTSQQDIDSITKTMGDDFSKIQGRFNTRVSLSSADVDEVIRKRILYKKDDATELLKELYTKNEFTIKNIITFSEGTPNMPLYKDAEDFAAVYPFIPYQFKLLGDVLTSVRQYSSSGKHMADGERSMLALFKEAADYYKEENEGLIVPFNAFYKAIDDFVDHTHRIVISQAQRNTRLDDFDVELLKVLFMIKHVNSFKGDIENLTTLMVSNINEDVVELKKKIETSLRKLCDEMLVQKNIDRYVFLTNEEQEAENAIRATHIDSSEVVNYIGQIAFDEVIAFPNSKYKYSNRYQFSFNQMIDDRFHKSNQSNSITLHLLTAYSGKEDEMVLSMLSAEEKSVVVRLSDNYAYITETEEMKKIEAFLNSPNSSTLTDYEIISANKRKERTEKAKRIKDYVRMALESAEIYVRGEKLSTKAKEVTSRINEAFEKLVASEYSKLRNMTTEPSQSDILDYLKKTKSQMTLDLEGMMEDNQEALGEMLSEIKYASKMGTKFSIKQAMDKFMAAPYGYIEEDVEYLIAVLYKKGQIALKMNSVVYTPASTTADDAYKYITKREYREKVLVEIKEVPKNQWIKSVKDVIKDFFGKSIMNDDSDALMRDYKSYCVSKKDELQNILKDNYWEGSPLPGESIVKKAIRLIEDTEKIGDPMTFYKQVDDLYDDFDEVSLQLGDLTSFLNGVQKEKFLRACDILDIYEASKNYISDSAAEGYADDINRIKNIKEPYNLINKMEGFANSLEEVINDLLKQGKDSIEPNVESDRSVVIETINKERAYAEALQRRFEAKFDALIQKLKNAKDIASLQGISLESNALMQICINEINKAEESFVASQKPVDEVAESHPSGFDKPKAVPAKVIKTIPVNLRQLTGNKTYTIRTEEDVDAAVEEIRQALMDQIGEDKIIKLS